MGRGEDVRLVSALHVQWREGRGIHIYTSEAQHRKCGREVSFTRYYMYTAAK